MEPRLLSLIGAYLEAVKSATTLKVESGITLPKSNIEWACSDIPQKGQLTGGVLYFKHGYGCAVHLPSGIVDFDFGANGEINGFDLWRLSGFAAGRLHEFGFRSKKELESIFNAAEKAEEFTYSGYILFYLASNSGLVP